MKGLLATLALIFAVVVAIGFWQGWFAVDAVVASDENAASAEVNASVDKDEIRDDIDKTKQKVEESVGSIRKEAGQAADSARKKLDQAGESIEKNIDQLRGQTDDDQTDDNQDGNQQCETDTQSDSSNDDLKKTNSGSSIEANRN